MKFNRILAVVVLLAVVAGGISMANKPNEGDGISITIAPRTLAKSRPSRCLSVHSNIPIDSVNRGSLFADFTTFHTSSQLHAKSFRKRV